MKQGWKLSSGIAAVCLGWAATFSHAADSYWDVANGDFTNTASWIGGVPGANDDAYFSNNAANTVNWTTSTTTSNALFDTKTAGSVTLNISNSTWWVTDRFLVGPTLGTTGLVVLASGTLAVTNTDGTAATVVGQGGRGDFRVNGGSLDTDLWLVTNGANSKIQFNSGAVTTRGALVDVSLTGAALGIGSSGTSVWNMVAGTNIIINAAGFGTTLGAGNFTRVIFNVSGNGTVWTNTGGITFSPGTGARSDLNITDGGKVYSGSSTLGSVGGTNQVFVSGNGSLWRQDGTLFMGSAAKGNRLIVTNQGQVVVVGDLRVGESSTTFGNLALVTGQGSILSNLSTMYVGRFGSHNELRIEDGGFVRVNSQIIMSEAAAATNNSIIVSGTGSLLSTPTLNLGWSGDNNSLIVSNGGAVSVSTLHVSRFGGSSNNTVLITGPGSILSASLVNVGSNAATVGHGSILIEDGGTLETGTLVSGFNGSGTVSNRHGVYQFATTAPVITTNTAGNIVLTNGTISYRNVTGANIFYSAVSNITFQGNNTFQLNNATNAAVAAYTYDSIANTGDPRQYQRLALVNGGSRWQGATLTVGSGGALLVSNSANAVVTAVVTNAGTIAVINSKMTWTSNVVIHGSYVSDPSTNTFLADATVSESGTLVGGAGDLFDFKKNLLIHSTNATGFQLGASEVMFSGGGVHTNAITGLDLGTNDVGFANNFAYGALRLGSETDSICFQCGNLPAILSNGLYVGWLDLLDDTNLVANLYAPSSIHIYYDKTDTRNAYLGGLTYSLLDCDLSSPGGMLIGVIPEPSSFVLAFGAACGILWRRHRRAG